jgi:hypothetical protein
MGNYLSFYKKYEDKNCYLCKEKIKIDELVKCVRCEILLHCKCEEENRKEKTYCMCPSCHRIGTLGIKY